MKTLILATHDTGKIAELRALLSPIESISKAQTHQITSLFAGCLLEDLLFVFK